MYIPNDDTQNYQFCKLQLMVKKLETSNELANQNSIKVTKVIKPANKYCKTLETCKQPFLHLLVLFGQKLKLF